MKIASFNEINRCIQKVNKLTSSGRLSLFGRGTDNVVINSNTIPNGQTLMDYYLYQYPNAELPLEFGNLTINNGANVKVTDVKTDEDGNQINGSQVAYLKVNGTLTVNGHLHMDNAGGYFTSNTGTIITDSEDYPIYNNNFAYNSFNNLSLPQVAQTGSCTNELWSRLTNYGIQETFFTGTTALTGAGGSGHTRFQYDYWVDEETGVACESPWDDETYPKINPYCNSGTRRWGYYRRYKGQYKWFWNSGGYNAYKEKVIANTEKVQKFQYETRGAISNSCLSGSGDYNLIPKTTVDGKISIGGGGGGFIAIYGESLVNRGPHWLEGNIRRPLNVHANGGTELLQNVEPEQEIRGGGGLIISAKRVVIGPYGSITADGGNGQGLMTLLNRPPYTGLYTYNNGSPAVYTDTLSGGAGYAQFFQR